ncbi:MAG: putative F420-dependent oxidoreductase, Rv3093c family [Acidimicrobiia bacterium]|nr:putative F420-dependent oxidoreductase, Rv3093c family [Acidimicrobiia bacterium]
MGVTFGSLMSLGPSLALRVATTAEGLGYRSFWTAETTGPEAFSLLAAVGAAAPRLALGTGVLPLQLRTPMLAAMGAATLQALHPDNEIILGVGVSSPVVTGQWHGVAYVDRPVAQVREYVTLLRECLSGETVTFSGDFFSCRRFRLGLRPGPRRPTVLIGALNPAMLRLAGEVADAVMLNYLPAHHVPWAVERVREGEATAGRTPGSTTVYGCVHAGVADRDQALERSRRDLWSYAVVDAYARSFERAGFGDVVREVRARHRAGDRQGAIAAVSDDFADAINIVGDPARVSGAIDSYLAAGVDEAVVMPLPWGPDRFAVVEATLKAAGPRSAPTGVESEPS